MTTTDHDPLRTPPMSEEELAEIRQRIFDGARAYQQLGGMLPWPIHLQLSTDIPHLLGEVERLRADLAFAREEAKSIYDTCKQIERERDTAREVAQSNKHHVATLSALLERVEAMTVDPDGNERDPDTKFTAGEIRRAIQERVAGEAGAR